MDKNKQNIIYRTIDKAEEINNLTWSRYHDKKTRKEEPPKSMVKTMELSREIKNNLTYLYNEEAENPLKEKPRKPLQEETTHIVIKDLELITKDLVNLVKHTAMLFFHPIYHVYTQSNQEKGGEKHGRQHND